LLENRTNSSILFPFGIEYLIEENRILRRQIGSRILLTDAERTLAEKAVALGRLMADPVGHLT